MGRNRNSSRSNSRKRDQTNPEYYAEADFYGLTFGNVIQDFIDFDRPINFNPNISLIENNSKAVFNFTGCDDDIENDYIDKIINGISLTDGFTLSDAQHIDAISGEVSDLSGYYTCGATYSKVIVANVSSVTSVQDYNKNYKSSGFVSEIKTDFSKISKVNTTESNQIENLFGRNINPSFSSVGVRKDDYVRIEEGLNAGKYFPVEEFSIDKNDYETLTFGLSADFVDESRFNQKTKLRFYRVGNSGITGGEERVNYTGSVVVITPSVAETVYSSGHPLSGGFSFSDYDRPILTLAVGGTYVFNLLGGSGERLLDNQLEFRISTTSDGKWNGGVEHPDVKICGNTLVFYPEQAGEYYYYSNLKPNCGGRILVFEADPEIITAEPYIAGVNAAPPIAINPGTGSITNYLESGGSSTIFY